MLLNRPVNQEQPRDKQCEEYCQSDVSVQYFLAYKQFAELFGGEHRREGI